jgi:alkanesulfonate monooxygenase SsuD/methylene tetrahydromethanopterin reductase-like flavin-dependent oxidoreductase (luciferase family)
VCAALAAATERIRLGTAVLPLLLHHPLRVAEDAATLDALSNGRFELGVGLGEDRAALSGFGVEGSERAERLDEALELVQAAWRGPLAFAGRHFQVEGIEVVPRPVQRGGPPVWVGAGAPAAQRRAARLGAGLILPATVSPAFFLEAWADEGRDPAAVRLAVLLPASARRDPVAAVARWLARLPAEAAAAAVDAVLCVSAAGAELDAVLGAVGVLHEAHPTRRERIYWTRSPEGS